MLLSKPQQSRFWREWSAACRRQGWTKSAGWSDSQIDNERHALLLRAGFSSLTEVDHLAGFDLLLAELAAINHPDDIGSQLRQSSQPKTRLIYAINTLAHKIAPSKLSSGQNAYLAAILLDRVGHTNLDDLSEQELTQIRNTLTARSKSKSRRSTDPF
jgi:hypothetical protein